MQIQGEREPARFRYVVLATSKNHLNQFKIRWCTLTVTCGQVYYMAVLNVLPTRRGFSDHLPPIRLGRVALAMFELAQRMEVRAAQIYSGFIRFFWHCSPIVQLGLARPPP